MILAGLWCFALGRQHSVGVLVCSGEDEEGEEGCQQRVYPPALPLGCLQAAVWVGAGCLNGASIPVALSLLLCGTTKIISVQSRFCFFNQLSNLGLQEALGSYGHCSQSVVSVTAVQGVLVLPCNYRTHN